MCVLISNLWAVHDKWFPAALWLLGAIVMFIMERAAALAGDGSGAAAQGGGEA